LNYIVGKSSSLSSGRKHRVEILKSNNNKPLTKEDSEKGLGIKK
jgi:hypothetical protein